MIEISAQQVWLVPGPTDMRKSIDGFAAIVSRKASDSISRRTGKPVIDSTENIELKGQFRAASITLRLADGP